MKKYIAAAVLISIVLAAGCSGNVSVASESAAVPESSAAEATTSASTAQSETTEEAPAAEELPKQTEESAVRNETAESPQTGAPQETTLPENPGGYIADWIYGTWSAVSVDGRDYWDYAFENGLTEQSQLIFDSEGVRTLGGEVGVEQEYTYIITDKGADIYYSFGEKAASLAYDPTTDTMTVVSSAPEGITVVVKRGEYPQPEAGLDYIADWIYGTWSVISVNGEDFGSWAARNDIDGEYLLNFTAQGVEVLVGETKVNELRYRITDEGAEMRDTDGTSVPIIYSPSDDTLSFTMDGYTAVMKRGKIGLQ